MSFISFLFYYSPFSPLSLTFLITTHTLIFLLLFSSETFRSFPTHSLTQLSLFLKSSTLLNSFLLQQVARVRILYVELAVGLNLPSLEAFLTVEEPSSSDLASKNVPKNVVAKNLLHSVTGDLWLALGD